MKQRVSTRLVTCWVGDEGAYFCHGSGTQDLMLFNVLHTQSVQAAMVFENPHTPYTMEVSSNWCWLDVLISYQTCSLPAHNI